MVTVSHTSPSGEYVYLYETSGKIASRADAFMIAVKRPWHAWADPEWERRASEAAERFVRDGLPAAMLLGMPVRVDPSLPREVEFMLESTAPVATEARVPVEVSRRTDDEGTISFDAPGFTTIRTCRHCGALISGGPTACVHCVRALSAKETPPDPRPPLRTPTPR